MWNPGPSRLTSQAGSEGSKMSMTDPRQTFLNPTVPFTGTILGGLHPGEMVLIQGHVPSDADRFQVDFTCGSSVKPRADVAFHFNPRFGRSPNIVCNTLQNQLWGREEVSYQNPFTLGSTFEIIILVLRDQFKVAVDGTHVLHYDHRVALQRVNTLFIAGKVQVSAVGILSNSTSSETSVTKKPEQNEPVGYSLAELSVPFRAQLKGGLSVGHSITVTGRTNHNAESFCVNLRNSNSSDIALHLNPRLKKKAFVRNSFLCQSWGPEETAVAKFPFLAGDYFEIIILCDHHHFRVAVNGTHQLDYKHRVSDLKQITELEVLGDVQLLSMSSSEAISNQ
ncbi:galectin-8 [Takifugu rubripes]|uniref:Galectin n=1 Tax=Takifugu rubripes TaxID=31033 RepID=A0A674MUG7_TAKRU|nr:galectin-8 [Takifugu rubripes]